MKVAEGRDEFLPNLTVGYGKLEVRVPLIAWVVIAVWIEYIRLTWSYGSGQRDTWTVAGTIWVCRSSPIDGGLIYHWRGEGGFSRSANWIARVSGGTFVPLVAEVGRADCLRENRFRLAFDKSEIGKGRREGGNGCLVDSVSGDDRRCDG